MTFLQASSPDGYERRRFLVVLATTVYQLVFVASLHGQRTMCFTVGTAVVKANLARLHRSLDQHRREGSPEQSQMIDKGLHFLKLIRFHLDRDLVLEPTSSMSDYLYWMRCEATVLPGSSPCVKLPAGEEMACCAKVSLHSLSISTELELTSRSSLVHSASASATAPKVRPSCPRRVSFSYPWPPSLNFLFPLALL